MVGKPAVAGNAQNQEPAPGGSILDVRPSGFGVDPKSEIRNPKEARNPKSEPTIAACLGVSRLCCSSHVQLGSCPRLRCPCGRPELRSETARTARRLFQISGFGFPSDFGFRISDLEDQRLMALITCACSHHPLRVWLDPAGRDGNFLNVCGTNNRFCYSRADTTEPLREPGEPVTLER